jgi:hypothetical protein
LKENITHREGIVYTAEIKAKLTFFPVLGCELWGSCLLRQVLRHLNPTSSSKAKLLKTNLLRVDLTLEL